jgi:HK97 family phage prohead protease
MGDQVDPMGAKFKTPMPLLWQHDSHRPVGRVEFAKPTKAGLPFVAHLPKVAEAGILKDRIDEAVQSIKYRLVSAVSIGFRALEGGVETIKETGGSLFKSWEWLELSLVTIPANSEASITSIKSLDTALRAASGRKRSDVHPPPGDTGTKQQPASGGFFHSRSKGNQVKTLKELQETLQTANARQSELLPAIEAKTAASAELDEFDDLELSIKELETEIRVASFHERQALRSKSVDGSSRDAASRSRSARDNPVGKKSDPDDKFQGQSFARIVKTKAVAFLLGESQVTVAQHMFGKTHPNLVQHIKAAVAGGGTDSGEWGAELVGIDNRYTGDFVEYLYGMTGFDKLGLRDAPKNVSVKGMDAPAVGYWTGQSKAIKASAPSASTADLTALKIAGKCIISNELAMDSSPGAEAIVRDSLGEALATTLDTTFFSATAVSAGVSPAGIVNGLAEIAMGGTDAAAFRAFMNAAAAGFISAKTSSGLILAMSPGTALALGMLVNALGQSEFPMLTETGGTLLGRRVVVSDNIDPSQIFLINPREIWRIGDDGVDFAVSREAMVEQDSAPQGASDTPVASSATLVSMFDTDSLAIRATRRVSYKFRRTQAAAVAWTNTADFGGVAS